MSYNLNEKGKKINENYGRGIKQTKGQKLYKPTVAWNRERKKLKVQYESLGIKYCELMLKGCVRVWALGFAHRRKRVEYLAKEKRDLLGSYQETLLACNSCHDQIEHNKQLTESIFNHLRPSTANDEYHQSLVKRGIYRLEQISNGN